MRVLCCVVLCCVVLCCVVLCCVVLCFVVFDSQSRLEQEIYSKFNIDPEQTVVFFCVVLC